MAIEKTFKDNKRQNGHHKMRKTAEKKKDNGAPISGLTPKLSSSSSSSSFTSNQQHTTSLLVNPQLEEANDSRANKHWYDYGSQYPDRNLTANSQQQQQLVQAYRSQADAILRRELQLYHQNSNNGSNNNNSNNNDSKWINKTMQHGTLKDRIAARTVMISTYPFHQFFTSLDSLLSMAGCDKDDSSQSAPNARVAQLAAQALEDLWLNTYLPPKRKLLTLSQRPLHVYEEIQPKSKTKKTLSPRILLLWRFEELVKEKYHLFIRQYIAKTLQDNTLSTTTTNATSSTKASSQSVHKIAALRIASALLRGAPEAEQVLLALLVNKLGDPHKQVAAVANNELRRLLFQHAAMLKTVAREVQQLAHRPRLSHRAIYQCVIFLNQLVLKQDDGEDNLAVSLIKTYFRLFEVAIQSTALPNNNNNNNKKSKQGKFNKKKSKKHGNNNKNNATMNNNNNTAIKSKLLSALLSGVHRAHPYLPDNDTSLEEHVDALYRVVHQATPSSATQALLLLFHLCSGSSFNSNVVSEATKKRQDRFYRALYAVLGQPAFVESGKHLTIFFNLVYKALKYDTEKQRIMAMSKRLLCTTMHSAGPTIAASLFLLDEVSKVHSFIKPGFYETAQNQEALLRLDWQKREPLGALVVVDHDDNNNGDKIDQIAKCPMFEIATCMFHFHPSVVKFAQNFGEIEYSGDPLKDFTLAPFLDKFAYRNPKSSEKVAAKFSRGESIAERKSGNNVLIQNLFALPVNDPVKLNQTTFSVEEEFFRTFFVEQARRDKLKGIVRHKSKEENEATTSTNYDSDTDSEEEAFIDSLARKLIDDNHGPVDIDDYDDSDADDFSLQEGEEGEDSSVGTEDENEENEENDDIERANLDDSDDHVDLMSDDSDEDDEIKIYNKALVTGDDELDGFMDQSDSSDDDDDDDLLPLFKSPDTDASSEESDDDNNNNRKKTNKEKKRKKDLPLFADAEDYERMIQQSWKGLKHVAPADEDDDTADNKRKKITKPNAKKSFKKQTV